jgi:intracellular protein transport protein USO1
LHVSIRLESSHLLHSNHSADGDSKISIVDALLETVFAAPARATFDIRLAACECIKAYFKNNSQIQLGFLNYTIHGYNRHEYEATNILTTLVEGGAVRVKDPYRIRFASVLLFHLISDNTIAKATLMKVSEGDAERGEEVITCIQLIAGNLVASIERDEDERVIIAYFMLLCTWLFEDTAAVNDFLEEGSLLQTLIQRVSMPTGNVLVKGLAATLVGILYHYSTKESPIPRRNLQEYLASSMGRDNYLRALFNLRQHKSVREYGVPVREDSGSTSSAQLRPEAYFDSTFVDFLNDNFSIFNRALDRDPDSETLGFSRPPLHSQPEQKENANSAARSETGTRVIELEHSLEALEKRMAELEVSKTSAERERKTAEEALADTQSNFDALMTVLDNSEERRRRQKVNPSTLGRMMLIVLETTKRTR